MKNPTKNKHRHQPHRNQAQTQTQSQTPSSSQEESQIKDVVLGIEDYSMLFDLGLAGTGGMLLIWSALKFKRI